MEATLDVQNIAFCTLDIEGSRVPPTMNFVDSIFIQDGFGSPIPVLQLYLNDRNGTLSEDMNLQDGTLVTVKMGKTRDKVKTRKFRVFSFAKQTTAAGPKLVVTCIIDAPKWTAGVFTESVRGTSSAVIGQMASRAGLKYDGPSATDDAMTWLNVNKTRTAFTEDVAMRGYGSGQTCMTRLLTMDYEVKYKDLFDILKQEPKWSLLQNTAEGAAKATPIIIRETQDASTAGFATHMMNYGQKQYEHSLNDSGQLNTLSADAPLLGAALPINEDVRGQVSDRGAKVNYTGFDTGTEPRPASNLHQNYEKAMYQNMRYLGLFSERIKVLTDEYTESSTFDCVEYQHGDQDNHEFKQSKALGGKWLMGGRTLWIKAGHKYSEVYFLYRPAVMETGRGSAAGKPKTGSQQNAKANEGPINIAEEQGAVAETNVTPPAAPVQNPQAAVPAATGAKNTLTALKEHAAVNPLIPSTPISPSGVPSNVLASQDKLRSSVSQFAQSQGPLRDQLVTNQGIGTLEGFKTLKKYGANVVKVVANGHTDPRYLAQEIDRMRRDSSYAKNAAINRVTNVGTDITGVRLHNIVSAASGNRVNAQGIVGDVLNGGLWADDLRAAGISPSSINVPLPIELEIIENPLLKAGGTFLHNATGLGFDGRNILINPYATAHNIARWSTETDPSRLLVEQGARAYINTFGHVSPTEAATTMADVGKLAAEVALMYSRNEVLVDSALTDNQKRDLAQDILFTFGDPTIVPVVDSVDRIVDYGQYHDVTTSKDLVTWADYYSMGAKLANSVDKWDFPFNFPGEEITAGATTNGNATQFDESTQKWMQS